MRLVCENHNKQQFSVTTLKIMNELKIDCVEYNSILFINILQRFGREKLSKFPVSDAKWSNTEILTHFSAFETCVYV